MLSVRCTLDVDSDDSHTPLHSPLVCQDSKDTESDTRHTWQRCACRVDLGPVLVATENRESLPVSLDEC